MFRVEKLKSSLEYRSVLYSEYLSDTLLTRRCKLCAQFGLLIVDIDAQLKRSDYKISFLFSGFNRRIVKNRNRLNLYGITYAVEQCGFC